LDAKLSRVLANHLSESAIAVDDREHIGIEHQRRRLIGLQPSGAHPFEILADANHAVRVVPDEIGIDEPARDRMRFLDAAARGVHDRCDKFGEPRRRYNFHQWISGSGVGALPSRKSKSQPWLACVIWLW